jgi:hypothetical protein
MLLSLRRMGLGSGLLLAVPIPLDAQAQAGAVESATQVGGVYYAVLC